MKKLTAKEVSRLRAKGLKVVAASPVPYAKVREAVRLLLPDRQSLEATNAHGYPPDYVTLVAGKNEFVSPIPTPLRETPLLPPAGYYCGCLPPSGDNFLPGTVWHEVTTGKVFEWKENPNPKIAGWSWVYAKPQPTIRLVAGGRNNHYVIGLVQALTEDEPDSPSLPLKKAFSFKELLERSRKV